MLVDYGPFVQKLLEESSHTGVRGAFKLAIQFGKSTDRVYRACNDLKNIFESFLGSQYAIDSWQMSELPQSLVSYFRQHVLVF